MDYVKGGHSYYTAETHIMHLGEAKLGDRLTGTVQVLGRMKSGCICSPPSCGWSGGGDGGTDVPACRYGGGQDLSGGTRGSGEADADCRGAQSPAAARRRRALHRAAQVKRVLITAGANGIGLVMARAFQAAGYRVWVTDVDHDPLAALPPGSGAAIGRRRPNRRWRRCLPRLPTTGAGWTCCAPMPGSRVRRRRSRICRWRAGISACRSIWTARCWRPSMARG